MSAGAPTARGTWFVVIQLSLLALVVLGPRTIGSLPAWPAPWALAATLLGALLGLAGAGLALAGSLQLGRNLTPFPRPRTDSTLVVTGAYRLVRHPIYSGLLFMSFGWALFVNGTLTLLYSLALAFLLDAKTRFEEQWLVSRFDDYRSYRQRVRKLIPFLY